VNIDYHIVFDANYYSVPYNLVQKLVEVCSSHNSQRGCVREVTGTPSLLASTVHVPPGASGVDSLPHGALGANHRSQHCAAFRADHDRQAAPGDGLPFMPRYAQTTHDRKTARHAAPRHGRVTEDAGEGAGPDGARTEFPRTLGSLGGSAVELARESGTREAAEDIDCRGARGLDKA